MVRVTDKAELVMNVSRTRNAYLQILIVFTMRITNQTMEILRNIFVDTHLIGEL